MTTADKNVFSLLAIALTAVVLAAGCEDAETKEGVSWNGNSASTSKQTKAASSESGSTSADSSSDSDGSGTGESSSELDEVSFSNLNFSFGGVNGSRAVCSGVVIAGLSATGSPPDGHLSFRYVKNLRAWGYTDDRDAPALACFFVKRSDGTWVGGKMDWIGTSRTSRDFHNLHPGPDGRGYSGWTLSGVPNPCECAFLILKSDGKRRSNVIKATWRR